MPTRTSTRLTKLVLACTMIASPIAYGQTFAPGRYIFADNKGIDQIRGAWSELHRMTPLGASGEFVNEDIGTLSIDENPCIFVASATHPQSDQNPQAAYVVVVECFDLVASSERKLQFYSADAKGTLIPGKPMVAGEYSKTDPAFDETAWQWISGRVSPSLAKRMQMTSRRAHRLETKRC